MILSVRDFTNGTTGEWLFRGALTWCPACATLHLFRLAADDGTPPPSGPVWTWNGSTTAPTFEASMLVRDNHPGGEGSVCHSFLRNGVWDYLPDSTHALAGQQVPMIPLPLWLQRDERDASRAVGGD